MTGTQRLSLLLGVAALVVLVIAVAIGQWWTAIGMVLVAISQLLLFTNERRKRAGRPTSRA